MSLGDRLRQARLAKGLTQREAAEAAGVDSSYISRYESGQREPSALALRGLAAIYGVPVDGLTGESDDEPSVSGAPQAMQVVDDATPTRPAMRAITAEEAVRNFQLILDEPMLALKLRRSSLTVDDMAGIADYIRFVRSESKEEGQRGSHENGPSDDVLDRDPVDVNELAAAAGGGAEVYDETVVGRLWFRRDWLQRNAIDPKQCHVISVRGESMEPTLPDGCSILVDRSQNGTRRRDGRIFVLRTGDGLVVKRAGKDEAGQWQIVSDHPAWDPMRWTGDTEIIGEVRWLGRTV